MQDGVAFVRSIRGLRDALRSDPEMRVHVRGGRRRAEPAPGQGSGKHVAKTATAKTWRQVLAPSLAAGSRIRVGLIGVQALCLILMWPGDAFSGSDRHASPTDRAVQYPAAKPKSTSPSNVRASRVVSLRRENLMPIGRREQLAMKHFYGDDVSLAYFHFPPGSTALGEGPMHRHGQELFVVDDGSTIFSTDQGDMPLAEGDVVLVPAGVRHGGRLTDAQRHKGVSLISVVTPAREYGKEGETDYSRETKYQAQGAGEHSADSQETRGKSAAKNASAPRKLMNLGQGRWRSHGGEVSTRKYWRGDPADVGAFWLESKDELRLSSGFGASGEMIAMVFKGDAEIERGGHRYELGEGDALIGPSSRDDTVACPAERCLLVVWFRPAG